MIIAIPWIPPQNMSPQPLVKCNQRHHSVGSSTFASTKEQRHFVNAFEHPPIFHTRHLPFSRNCETESLTLNSLYNLSNLTLVVFWDVIHSGGTNGSQYWTTLSKSKSSSQQTRSEFNGGFIDRNIRTWYGKAGTFIKLLLIEWRGCKILGFPVWKNHWVRPAD